MAKQQGVASGLPESGPSAPKRASDVGGRRVRRGCAGHLPAARQVHLIVPQGYLRSRWVGASG